MAKTPTAAVPTRLPKPLVQLRDFLREVKSELSKVTWPSKEELRSSTQVVLIMLAVLAAIIYGYDMVYQNVMVWLLQFG